MKPRRLFVILLLFSTTFSLLFSMYSILRAEVWYRCYGNYGYDLSVFSESLNSTLNGRGFLFNTREWQDHGAWSHFGTHNSPILFLLLLPYAVHPSVHTLLIIQALAVSLAALVLFEFSREVLKSEKSALAILAAYLFNPLTHGVIAYEFHPCVLGVPFMFLYAYFMERGELRKATLAALLILSVKEDAGLFLIAYSVMRVLQKWEFKIRGWFRDKVAVSFAALGLVWILFSVFIVIPHFNLLHRYPYFADAYSFPWTSRTRVFSVATLKLLIALMSTGFVMKPKYLPPLLLLWMENSLSTRFTQATIGYQYDYMFLPLLFIVVTYSGRDWNQTTLLKILIVSSVISMFLFSPIFGLLNACPASCSVRIWTLISLF